MNDHALSELRRDYRAEENEATPSDGSSRLTRTESGLRYSAVHEVPALDVPPPSTRLPDLLLPPASEISKRVILIVGLDLAPTLSGQLHAAGFLLWVATTIENAKRLASEHIPAAILVAPLAGPDPYRFLHWIRNQRRLGFVQVFVFESPESDGFSAAIVAGADDILSSAEKSSAQSHEEAVDRIAARVTRSQALAELSLSDPLTELHNRRFMNERLPAEIARAARSGSTLTLALLDIDHFKNINDTLGHIAGDRALVAFAWMLRSNLRAYDIVCRFGGDEFVVLFPDCPRARAHEALSHLNAQAASLTSDASTVTFSAGMAEFPNDGRSWTDLLEAADTHCRRAKKLGASHIVSGSDETDTA